MVGRARIEINIDAVARETMGELQGRYGDMLSKMPVQEALLAFKDLVRMSPVDTGYYRAGHDLSVGEPSKYRPKSPYEKVMVEGKMIRRRAKRKYQSPVRRAMRRLKRYKPGMSIYVTNRCFLNHLIEWGSVKSKPRLVFERAQRNAEERLKRL